jgi:hypothetical protein
MKFRATAILIALGWVAAGSANAQSSPEIAVQAPVVHPREHASVAATVQLTVVVDEDGHVTDVSVDSGDARFLHAATYAARRLVFRTLPANGRTTAFTATVTYEFIPGRPGLAKVSAVFPLDTVTVLDANPVAQAPTSAVAITVDAEAARRVPGTANDPAKVVEVLPGLGRGTLGSGDLILWGSSPAESRVYVDGIEIPYLFHRGGLRAAVPSPFVARVEVLPGAYGATMGRGLGGLVGLGTIAVPAGVHGEASLDPLDATLHASAAHGARLRVAGAWREGLVHRVLGEGLTGEAGRLVAVPRMRDQAIKATAVLNAVEELHALVFASSDELTRQTSSVDPLAVRSETWSRGFWRAGLRYVRLASGGREGEVLVWLGSERSAHHLAFGAVPALQDVDTRTAGARILYREEPSAKLAVSAGLDALVTRAQVHRQGSLTLPPREGDAQVFGQPPGADVNADTWQVSGMDVAPFASAELNLGGVLVTAGARLQAQGLDVSRLTPRIGDTPAIGGAQSFWSVDPRMSACLRIADGANLIAAMGRYHQLPSPEDASAVFGTPILAPAHGEHGALGTALRWGAHVNAELTFFAKRLRGLPVRSPAPRLAELLTNGGRGRAEGVQLWLRATVGQGFSAWVAYTLSRGQRQDSATRPARLSDFDQTHVLSVFSGYGRGPWHVSTRFRYATGAPRTPVDDAYYDIAAANFSPVFGDVNTIRLPAFMQVDARVERTFVWKRSTIDLYLELVNLTGRRNGEEFAYNFDYSQRDVITGLPFFAVMGARLRF